MMKSLSITVFLLILSYQSTLGQSDTGETRIGGPSPVAVYDTPPAYPGGDQAIFEFMMKNIRYPEEAMRKGIEGDVYVGFNISVEGEVSDFKIIRRVNPFLDEEALRVISKISDYSKPAVKDGKPVEIQMIIPVKFKLS